MDGDDRKIIDQKNLREAVIELLINKIGSIFQSKKNKKKNKNLIKTLGEKLAGFKEDNKEIRIFFLGKNDKTKKLHWLFLNKEYNGIKRENILKKLLKMMGDDLIDPTNIFEVPKEPQVYTDKELKKYEVFEDLDGNNKNGYYSDNNNNKKIGLAMLAFKEKKVYYSEYAPLDPRSYLPGKFDVKLGFESALYLPVSDANETNDAEPVGVLVITWDSQNTRYKNMLEKNKKSKWKLYDPVKKTSENKTKVYENAWYTAKSKLSSGVQVLKALFGLHLKTYMDYLTNFNMHIISENINKRSGANSVSSGLDRLHSLEVHPFDYVMEFIETNREELPAINHILSLKDLEPLLSVLGKREHFIHMFNTFLTGNILLKKFLKNVSQKEYKTWMKIALSHDIGYPIEMLEKEITEFLERFFHKKKYPDFLISKELFYSYSRFPKYFSLLIEGAGEVLSLVGDDAGNSFGKVDLFEDMMIYNFNKRMDHAIISALFTMHFSDNGTLKDKELKKIGVPILMHNFYAWKFYYRRELEKVDIEESIDFNGDDQPELRPDAKDIFIYLWDRRFRRYTKEKGLKNAFNRYKKNVDGLYIDFKFNPTSKTNSKMLKVYTIILSLVDFFQEWGRLMHKDKGLASIGMLIKNINIENKKTPRRVCNVELLTPYVTRDREYVKATRCSSYARWYYERMNDKGQEDESKDWDFSEDDFNANFEEFVEEAEKNMGKGDGVHP